MKLAKLVGADFTMNMLNPPVREEFARVIFKHINRKLFVEHRCEAVSLGPIGGKYAALKYLRSAIKESPRIKLAEDCSRSKYATFILPPTYEEYTKSLGKNTRKNLRSHMNRFLKSFKMSQDFIQTAVEVADDFKNFVLMHTNQWRERGKLGHFDDWPQGAEYNYAQALAQSKMGRLRLMRLFANQKVVSYQLNYSFGSRWYARLTARVIGPEWDNFRIGNIGRLKMFQNAISEGVKEIESGAGHYEHKLLFGAEEHPLYTLFLYQDTFSCRLKTMLFLKMSQFINFLYYRIWFIRIAPKLPIKRKPLWRLWIRTRV